MMVRTQWVSSRCTISQRLFVLSLILFFTFSLSLYIHYGRIEQYLTGTQLFPSASHTITDGLLIVNPTGPHPIFQLIRDAEEAWSAKRARTSTTLAEAVAEYERRYHRPPPLGFDTWWAYAIRHDVRLPDEYDDIYDDIEPFWGIDPRELADTQSMLETKPELFTIAKTKTSVEIVRSTVPEADSTHLLKIVNNLLALLRDVAHELPPFRFSLSPHDRPDMMSDWRIEHMAREAAANGTTLTEKDLPEVTQTRGWTLACAPDSPAHRIHSPVNAKTFVASHRATMDPCKHPSLLVQHGQFLSHKQGPIPQRTLVPRFSLCASALHHDIRPPVPYGWTWPDDPDDGAFDGDVRWEYKVDERLGWRGRTTGMYAEPDSWWTLGHRARLVTLTSMLEGNVTVLMTSGEEPVGEGQTLQRARVNPAWMDVAFTDEPVGCEAETCAKMEALWEFRSVQDRHDEGKYKYIIDVDGNGWSGRFKRLMTSNALIFKSTVYPEWYSARIEPWVHYVPIQVSYADLYDTLAFFREHDDLAKQIAQAGRAWSREYWRQEDMTAYFYRLLLEYARVTSVDRASMNYKG